MYDVAVSTLPFLLEGLWMTFKISLITIFFGSIVGVVVGMLRQNHITHTLQVEGAQSVGMTYLQCMRYVVLPQAFARVAPTLLGQTAVLIKDSSLVSFIGVFELFGAGLIVLNERLMPNEGFLTVAVSYLMIYAVMLQVTNYAQRRLGGARA